MKEEEEEEEEKKERIRRIEHRKRIIGQKRNREDME